ncbi:NrS-1 polymerase-like domain-containing protein [Nitratiruptor sp. SB155-2]|nr:DUF5906 domain-containing protein [Nitratiruptor sp. SB155-2]
MEIPAIKALSRYAQWVIWKKERDTKIPYNPNNGKKASSTDPLAWGDIDEAQAGLVRYGANGLGFVLTKSDPFVFIDLDHVLDENKRVKCEWARQLLKEIKSYTEISPSGDGLHVVVSGKLPDYIKHKTKFDDGSALEVYESGRYMTITGEVFDGRDDIKELDLSILGEFAEHKIETKNAPVQIESATTLDDEAIIDLMKRKGQWPDAPKDGDDWSSLDMSFANRLAFWCGKDIERMDRIFRQSPLMRQKWDRPTAGSTYGRITLKKACDFVDSVYDPALRNESDCPFEPYNEEGGPRNDKEEKDPLWLYKVLLTKGIEVWFDIKLEKYGIKRNNRVDYIAKSSLQQIVFEIIGKTPKNIAVPTYIGAYEPSKPEKWEEEGIKYINLFKPTPLMKVKPVKEMPEIVKNLLLNLFDYDAKSMGLFINWLAFIYQYKERTGVAWIFMGKQGTGKGLLVDLLKKIFEEHMSSNITDANLDSQFNPYLYNKLIVHLNEVSADNRKSRMLVKNRLKTWITDETLYINRKNMKEVEIKNFCNFIINSNETIPVDIEDSDRRFNVIECNNVLKEQEWWTTESYQEILNNAEGFAKYLAGIKVDRSKVNEVVMSEKKKAIVETTESVLKQIAKALTDRDIEWFLDNGLEGVVEKNIVNDFQWEELQEAITTGVIPNKYLMIIVEQILGDSKTITWIKRNIITPYQVGETTVVKMAGKPIRAIVVG